MTYVVDRPNIQLDAADCLAIKNALAADTGHGFISNSPNVNLDVNDIAKLAVAIASSGTLGVDTANLQLTAADVVSIAPHLT